METVNKHFSIPGIGKLKADIEGAARRATGRTRRAGILPDSCFGSRYPEQMTPV
jgi:hypothetical protein